MDSAKFIQALKNKSITEIESVPKSDLHSHAGRGGRLSYVEKMLNTKLTPLTTPLLAIASRTCALIL